MEAKEWNFDDRKLQKHKINVPTIVGIVLVVLLLLMALLWMLRVERPPKPVVEVSRVASSEASSEKQSKANSIKKEECSFLESSQQNNSSSEMEEQSEITISKVPPVSESTGSTHRPEPPVSKPREDKPVLVESDPPISSSSTPEESSSEPQENLSSLPEEKPKLNINTATKEDLMTLTGINISLAKKIIAYRDEIGGFTSIDQLLEIYGIDDRIFNRIKDDICV